MELSIDQLVRERVVHAIGVHALAEIVRSSSGDTDSVDKQQSNRKVDSNHRCSRCGSILPIELDAPLTNCPVCHYRLNNKPMRSNDRINELINLARVELKLPKDERVGFDMRKYIYTAYLQKPLFDDWIEATKACAEILVSGSIVIPPNERSYGSELLDIAKSLNCVADHQTDHELWEYNQRLAERRESDALAAYARGNANQLIALHHTVNGAKAKTTKVAMAQYRFAVEAFKQGSF